jgi:hypothetical protein
MIEKTMIKYSLKGRRDALQISRKIYGFTDASNGGKYKYERKGILSDYEYSKIANGVFWIDPKDKNQVIKKMLKLGLKLEIFDMIIKEH